MGLRRGNNGADISIIKLIGWDMSTYIYINPGKLECHLQNLCNLILNIIDLEMNSYHFSSNLLSIFLFILGERICVECGEQVLVCRYF